MAHKIIRSLLVLVPKTKVWCVDVLVAGVVPIARSPWAKIGQAATANAPLRWREISPFYGGTRPNIM